jgi:hypothetical protein
MLHAHRTRVLLKSDGLNEVAYQLARGLGVAEANVFANSLTYSAAGLVTGVTAENNAEPNSAGALLSRIREHKQATRGSHVLIIGGSPADFAARHAAPPYNADLLITLNHTRVRASQGAQVLSLLALLVQKYKY